MLVVAGVVGCCFGWFGTGWEVFTKICMRSDRAMVWVGVKLKRLEDAERDGNNIYCVINCVGSSSVEECLSVGLCNKATECF